MGVFCVSVCRRRNMCMYRLYNSIHALYGPLWALYLKYAYKCMHVMRIQYLNTAHWLFWHPSLITNTLGQSSVAEPKIVSPWHRNLKPSKTTGLLFNLLCLCPENSWAPVSCRAWSRPHVEQRVSITPCWGLQLCQWQLHLQFGAPANWKLRVI